MKFGKVPNGDLAMTVYPLDTAAAAAVLWDYGEISFDVGVSGHWECHFYRHKRIKILKQSGFNQGNIAIPFYSEDGAESIKDKKALVFAPTGEESEVPKKEFFIEKANDRFSRLRFTCPNLQVGAVIDYTYTIVSKSIFALPEWYFQADIPVRWSELRLAIPGYFNYIFLNQGGAFDIAETSERYDLIRLPADRYVPAEDARVRVAVNRYVRKDIPGLKEESYITTMDDYYARMRMQLSSINYPGQTAEQVMSNWPNLAEKLLGMKNFGEQISKKGNFKNAWEAILPTLAGGKSETEKAGIIYQFVNDKFEVDGLGGIFVQESLDDCFEKKSGRQHELNLLMIALMREAGIEVHPLLVSTRGHGKMFELYPFVEQFNHVLAFASLDGKELLMDAGNPFRPMGLPDIPALNGGGWLVDKNKPEWINFHPAYSSDTYFMNMALDEAGSLNGSVTLSCDGYSAVQERELLSSSSDGGPLKEQLLEWFPEAKVDSVSIDGQHDLDKPFKATIKCHLPNMAMVNDDFIYLTPALMGSFKENPLKLEQRIYPVDFPHPMKERMVLNLTLPEGYIVEDLPEPVNMVLPNDGGSFKFQMAQQATGLQLVSNIQINQLHFEPEEYGALRNFFILIAEKLGEQFVLKKA